MHEPIVDLDELSAAVNEALAEEPIQAEQVDAEKLAAMMERAKKLLAMAERGNTQAERDAFAEKAAEVMAKYGITAAVLTAGGRGTAPGQVDDWTATVTGPQCYDKVSLLAVIVASYGGQIIYVDKNTQRSDLRVYATTADMERIQVLWPSLLTQMATELNWASASKPHGTRADVFARSFIAGFASVVRDRLTLAERRAAQEAQAERDAAGTGGQSVALVLARRKDEVERAFKKAHPRQRTARRSFQQSQAGLRAGQTAGERANLGHSAVGA